MEQRNLLIAIVLSVGILIGFQFVFQRLYPTPPHIGSEATRPAGAAKTPSAAAPSQNANAPGAVAAKATETVAQAIAGKPRIDIKTPSLRGSIALIGAKFDDLTLARYRETVDPKSPAVLLLSPPGTENPYFAEFGWVAAEPGAVKLPGPDTEWKATGGPLTPATRSPSPGTTARVLSSRGRSRSTRITCSACATRCATPAASRSNCCLMG